MFIEKLNYLPRKIVRLLKEIGEFAKESGCRAFIVGGVVRDIYLEKDNLDFDVVIEGNGIDFAKKLSKKLSAKLLQHEKFMTSVLTMPDGLKIDIATARKEVYEYPGALPDVVPGKIEEDLSRRDFSINALAVSLNPDNFGDLIDFFQGLKDLKDKKIKILHELSFIDDPTRILRAIRFEQRFKFKIDEEAGDLIKQALKENAFDTVKPPRIWQELVLILKESNPKRYIIRLGEVCGLNFVHPKLRLDNSVIKLLELVNKAEKNFEKIYPKKESFDKWLMYFMVLTESLKLDDIKNIADKFNLKKQERNRIYSYKNINKNLFNFFERQYLRPSQIYIVLEPLSYEAIILLKIRLKTKIAKKRVDDYLGIYSEVKLSINGHDINELGVNLDSRFKEVLNRVFYKKLDGELESKEEELDYARELIENS